MHKLIAAESFSDFTLDPIRIDVWYFSLCDGLNEAHAYLNREEQARAKRFYFARHRRRFSIARALMRQILACYLHLPAHVLCFDYARWGKPFLNTTIPIVFNLSHSQDSALLAVGSHEALGVDIECLSQRPYLDLACELFSPNEINHLKSFKPSEQASAFFNIWVQKEAFVKAIGQGLGYPTQQFDVSLNPDQPITVYDSVHGGTWQIFTLMPKPQTYTALCCHPSITTQRHIHLNLNTHLLKS